MLRTNLLRFVRPLISRRSAIPVPVLRLIPASLSYSTNTPDTAKQLNAERLTELLRNRFKDKTTQIEVEDISGGCGAMFRVRVESPQFKGTTKIQQHKTITECLKAEIGSMHGITIETKTLQQ